MQKNKDYFKLKMRESRKRDKEFGIRYRGWEQMPNESYTDFKRRLKAAKLLCVVCLGATFFFQLIGIVI